MIPVELSSTELHAEGSKSIINRLLMLISYQKEPIIVSNFSSCSDISTMRDNFQKLGFHFDDINSTDVQIFPPEEIPSRFNLFVQDSATGLRFLLARLASIPKRSFRISISEQLQKRPLLPLLQILYRLGAKLVLHQDSISIEGSQLNGGVYEIPGNISSQFISALLLLSPTLSEDLRLVITDEIVSQQYIEMTISLLDSFGIIVEKDDNSFFIRGNQEIQSLQKYNVEPDYSSLSYFWALGAISKNPITTAFYPQSLQSDYLFIDILRKMGANVKYEPNKVLVNYNHLFGIEQSMKSMPDQVPTLAVLSLFAESPTTIFDINHLRYKESNRLQALADEIRKLGAQVLLTDDSLTIHPLQTAPYNVTLKTYSDHRLVMAFSILKLVYPQIELDDTKAVKKSNPIFFRELNKLIQSK